MDLANAEGGGFGARLEQPGRGHALHVVAQLVVVEHAAELGNQEAGIARADAHGQLVAIVGGRR